MLLALIKIKQRTMPHYIRSNSLINYALQMIKIYAEKIYKIKTVQIWYKRIINTINETVWNSNES